MVDVLTIPAPSYCTPQRFNLFLASKNIKAPLLGNLLLAATRGTSLNPYTLGCVAAAITNHFRDSELMSRKDLFFTGGVYEFLADPINDIVQEVKELKSLEHFPRITTEQVTLARMYYAQFVRSAEIAETGTTTQPPEPKPAPKPAEPVATPLPPIQTPPEPPKPPSKWKETARTAVTLLGWIVAAGAIFIPDHIELPIKAALEAIKIVLGF